jgi:hypothetical protein
MVRGLDGFFDSLVALCGFEGHREGDISRQFPVAMARGKHLFPFRTEQLSPSAPMVLGSQEPGRVGRRRFFIEMQTRRRPPDGRPSCVARPARTPVRRARSVADGGEAGLIARSHGAGAAGADADEWAAVRMGTALVGEARPRAELVDGILERRQGTRGRHGPEQEAPDAGALA